MLKQFLDLRVNLSKSEMVLVGSGLDIFYLTNTLGTKVSSLPVRYLGLPLGAFHNSLTI